MVLDGVIDPALTSSQINLGQAQGFELATRSFMADCVKRSSCPLGRDLDAGLRRLQGLLDRAGDDTVADQGSRPAADRGAGRASGWPTRCTTSSSGPCSGPR